ncbi:hypothetical protein ACLESO_42285 [Pyxidicoccus sp. 3LG]
MKRFNTGMWLAGLAASSIAIFPLACGPVDDNTGTNESPGEPQLAVQVQESFGGELGSALGIPVAVGNTTGKTNEVSSNCAGSNTAPDLSFTWTPPASGTNTYRFTTEGSALDTVLTIHPVNNSSNVLGCNDDEPGGASWSRLDLALTGGVGYTIVVDGYGKSAAAIQLNITRPGAPCTACNTPPNSCYQSSGVCQDGACVYSLKPLGASCDDGNFCTVNEICDGQGTCGGGTARTCGSPNQCQAASGTCSNNQCNYAPKASGTSCDDGNFCTLSDECNGSGTCGGGSTRTCNTPPSQCHQPTGTCSGNQCNYSLKSAGSTCDDGNPCTDNDKCNSSGTCAGAPRVCTQSSNACEQANGTCSNGACNFPPMPQGTPCNDGITCTSGDVCNGAKVCAGTVQCSINGACVPHGAVNPSNPCQICDTASSNTAWTNRGTNVACNDGNACTVNDVCNGAGGCGGSPMQCQNTQGQCYQAACVNGACITSPKASGAACDDGLSCTDGDRCNGSGQCTKSATACRPAGPCNTWTETCTESGECAFEGCPEGTYCTRYGCEGSPL